MVRLGVSSCVQTRASERLRFLFDIQPREERHMTKIALALATAAAIFTAAPLFVGAIPAKGENLKMAQAGLDVQVGRDRDEGLGRNRRDQDVTIGVGPSGVVVGPRSRQRCHTVATTVERDDGRRVTRTERRCD
jgi:hypothetical protein